MLVEAETIAGLRNSGATGRRIFVAGCAERAAQIFTGVRSGQDERSHDVGLFVAALDELWAGGATETFARLLSEVERFEEFEPLEEGLSDTAEIHAMYSALALRYALACAAGDDPDFAVKCGHVVLTAMEQMDRAVPAHSFEEEERRFQARDGLADGGASSVDLFRQECQAAARQRLGVLLSR